MNDLQSKALALMEYHLKKFPDFDSAWSSRLQARWLATLGKTLDRLAALHDSAARPLD